MSQQRRALCIDLDGTLLNTDSFLESALRCFEQEPLATTKQFFTNWGNRAKLKAWAYDEVGFDASTVPYDEEVIAFARQQKEIGVPIILATASNEHIAQAVSDHLAGLFDEIIASDSDHNLRGANKAEALVERYGDFGFDYMGNDTSDIVVWNHAHTAYIVNHSPDLAQKISGAKEINTDFSANNDGDLSTWLSALRYRQWTKNLLLFIAPIAAHKTDWHTLLLTLIGFVAFCLVSSAGYLANDLFDLDDDRKHPDKKNRPFANGTLNPLLGFRAIGILALLGLAIGYFGLSPQFAAISLIYLVATITYTLFFKSVLLLDVYTLGSFFTLRVIAGGFASNIPLSMWLLSFIWLFFTGLAFLKRYVELDAVNRNRLEISKRRRYRASDERTIAILGIATSALTIPILALYVASPDALKLYQDIWLLWIVVPLIWAWQSRFWLIASRGEMHYDPVEFAIKDRVSHIFLIAILVIMSVAQ